MNRVMRRSGVRMRPSEYRLLQYLHYLGSIGATDDDIVRSVKMVDKFRDLDELKRYVMDGVRSIGYHDDEMDTLSAFKIRIPSIGEVIQKAAGYVAGRVGGERMRKAVEQKVSDVNREATKVAKHPVGQAIIAGGLIAMTGGLGAGSLAANVGRYIAKSASTVASGAKALVGAAAKVGGAAWKGAGALGKMAITGVKKGASAIAGVFRRKDSAGAGAGVGGVPTPFTSGEGVPPNVPISPPVEYVPPAPTPRILDMRGAVANRANAEQLPLLGMLALAALLM